MVQEDLDAVMNGLVAAIVFDREGIADISDLLESVPSPDFENDVLGKIFDVDEQPNELAAKEVTA